MNDITFEYYIEDSQNINYICREKEKTNEEISPYLEHNIYK